MTLEEKVKKIVVDSLHAEESQVTPEAAFVNDLGADSIGEIRITGGGASSPLWAQIKADVTGKTLRTLREAETACLGAAIFAAVGVGAFDSIPAAARAFAVTDRTYSPSGADYRAAYAAFARLDNLLNNPA